MNKRLVSHHSVLIYVFAIIIVVWRLVLAHHLGLGDDEAYYWDWGRHLSLSYFDHPPLTGWIIGLTQLVFAKTEWCVRFPFILILALTTYGFYQLSVKLKAGDPLFNAVTLAALIPLYSFGSFMAFPDIPMLGAWVWSLNLSLDLKKSPEKTSAWVLLGVSVGLACLSKLTGLILLAGAVLWVFSQKELRNQIKSYRPWLALLVTLVILIPVFIWNAQNDFPTFRFQLLARHQGVSFSVGRGIGFILVQVLILSPFVFYLMTRKLKKEWSERSDQGQWLACFCLPGLLIFYAQPWKAEFLLHWTAPIYLPVLASLDWTRGRAFKINYYYLLFVNSAFLLLCSYPMMNTVHALIGIKEPFVPRNDFTNDFHGWSEAGLRAKELYSQLAPGSNAPLVLTSRYQLAGQLAFYSELPVMAYGDRANAYRFFEASPYQKDYSGTATVFVSDNRYSEGPEHVPFLKNCSKVDSLETKREGFLSHSFNFWICNY